MDVPTLQWAECLVRVVTDGVLGAWHGSWHSVRIRRMGPAGGYELWVVETRRKRWAEIGISAPPRPTQGTEYITPGRPLSVPRAYVFRFPIPIHSLHIIFSDTRSSLSVVTFSSERPIQPSNMQTTFVLASLAGSALANHFMAPHHLKRDLQARQTGLPDLGDIPEISDECQSAGLSVLASLPTPPPEIVSAEMKNPQTGDPCDFTAPASLRDEYESYGSSVISWASKNEDKISKALSACSDIASMATDLVAVCTSNAAAPSKTTGGAASSDKTPESDSGDSSSNSGKDKNKDKSGDDSSSETPSPTPSEGAAPRATGMAFAGLAMGLVAAAL